MMAATTTLTLGLVLRDVASDPYQRTREATDGPDVVASVARPSARRPPIRRTADLAGLEELANAPGVVDHSGPYPVTGRSFRHPVERRMCRPWGATPRPRRSTSPS